MIIENVKINEIEWVVIFERLNILKNGFNIFDNVGFFIYFKFKDVKVIFNWYFDKYEFKLLIIFKVCLVLVFFLIISVFILDFCIFIIVNLVVIKNLFINISKNIIMIFIKIFIYLYFFKIIIINYSLLYIYLINSIFYLI